MIEGGSEGEADARRITAMTIAGSDPTAGAGIQADLRAFADFGVAGACAITAITVQNTRGVQRVTPLSPDLVAAQIDAVASDVRIDAVKIGMLATGGIIETVAGRLTAHRFVRVVLDPVMIATSGGVLLEETGVAALTATLLPLVTVVTPNVREAEILTRMTIRDVDEVRRAAIALHDMGSRAVVIKGGHLSGPPVDVVFDGMRFAELTDERIAVTRTHGTGCAFSSALAARLAKGDDLFSAAAAAKSYVRRLIGGPIAR